MRARRRYIGVMTAAAATIALLTSCSDSAVGTPSPANESSYSQPKPSAKGSNVPKVEHPLDVAELKTDLCNTLSGEQVQSLGLKPGVQDSGKSGPVCEFDYANVVGNRVSFLITEKFTKGLANVYALKGNLKYFEETKVAGYPAVYAGKYDFRDKGTCQLHVGVSNTLVVTVLAQLNGGTDENRPCDVVKMSAEAMIKHLKDGA